MFPHFNLPPTQLNWFTHAKISSDKTKKQIFFNPFNHLAKIFPIFPTPIPHPGLEKEISTMQQKPNGRPAFQPTDEQRKLVQILAAYGVPQPEIARNLHITKPTLCKYFRPELTHGAMDANLKVLDGLFKMATGGRRVSATIFWARTRCGFRPGASPYESAPGLIKIPQTERGKN
jgi:hypothetical protein